VDTNKSRRGGLVQLSDHPAAGYHRGGDVNERPLGEVNESIANLFPFRAREQGLLGSLGPRKLNTTLSQRYSEGWCKPSH
jgi:hypothetical protein